MYERKTDARTFLGAPAHAFDSMKALEDARQLVGGDADPGIFHPKLDAIGAGGKRDLDGSLERELECVGEKIQHDLLPHLPIDVDLVGQRIAAYDELEPRALDSSAEEQREIGRARGKVDRLKARLRPTLFASREIEERIDETMQTERVAMN